MLAVNMGLADVVLENRQGARREFLPSGSNLGDAAIRPSSLVVAFLLGLVVSPIVFPDGIASSVRHRVD